MSDIQQTIVLLEAHESLLLPVLQGAQPAAEDMPLHASLAEVQQQALHVWLKSALNRPASAEELQHLPAQQAHRWRGWLAYFQGQYALACAQFIEGYQQLAQSPASVTTALLQGRFALGLGKVYTRSGDWHSARGWVLHAIDRARQCSSPLDIVKGYGALGELLLRGGYPRDALFCLGTARELLPAGAVERTRQWNYLASALMRLNTPRDQLAAESLLMSSYYLAIDGADYSSAVHALARLQFLELDRQQQRDLPELLQCPESLVTTDKPMTAQQGVPLGFLALGRAFAAWRRGDKASAVQHAAYASHCLRHTPAEQRWAQALSSYLQGQTRPPMDDLAGVDLHSPPPDSAVLDSHWLRPHLTDAGPAQFAPPVADPESLLHHRQVFFL